MKPPGHTCPAIDKAQKAMRRLHWRIRHPEHDPDDEDTVLEEGLAFLEQVREENKQMREAFHAVRERL